MPLTHRDAGAAAFLRRGGRATHAGLLLPHPAALPFPSCCSSSATSAGSFCGRVVCFSATNVFLHHRHRYLLLPYAFAVPPPRDIFLYSGRRDLRGERRSLQCLLYYPSIGACAQRDEHGDGKRREDAGGVPVTVMPYRHLPACWRVDFCCITYLSTLQDVYYLCIFGSSSFFAGAVAPHIVDMRMGWDGKRHNSFLLTPHGAVRIRLARLLQPTCPPTILFIWWPFRAGSSLAWR